MLSQTLEEIKEQLEAIPAHYLSHPVRAFLGEVAAEVKSLREKIEALEGRVEAALSDSPEDPAPTPTPAPAAETAAQPATAPEVSK